MSKASWVRLVVGMAGGVLALASWFLIANKTVALLVAGLIYLAASYAAERRYRRLAPLSEVRADLEVRVRNLPA
ncbi:MAG: hypothetical protein ABL901_06180 [Hyphomicrobiaceae bacterium]